MRGAGRRVCRQRRQPMKNPSLGNVSVKAMVQYIERIVADHPADRFHIAVGTDSQSYDSTKVVVAVVLYREGKGGTFFYQVKRVKKLTSLRRKIYYETEVSLSLAAEISRRFAEDDFQHDVEIHCDIGSGEKSKTRVLVNEIVGWVIGAGYRPVIKPYSYAASCVADRISK